MAQISVSQLFERIRQRGNGAYGLSDVTQLEHALQAAALADQQGLGDEMVIAALFHDIGHMFTEDDVDLAAEGIDDKHEDASADLLEPIFGVTISGPVRLHVASKRYFCASDPAYYDKLSQDSRTSLALQGGPMSDEEAAAFQALPGAENAVTLRKVDDRAKVPNLAVPPLDTYYDRAARLAMT